MGADRLDQRHQRRRRRADPVGQRRDVEVDALAGIGRALAVERQVQAVLGEQHMRQQARPGAAARDRMRRRRRLGDRSRSSGTRTSRARAGSPSTGAAPAPASRSRPRPACAAPRRSTGRPTAPDRPRARAAGARAAAGAPACAASKACTVAWLGGSSICVAASACAWSSFSSNSCSSSWSSSARALRRLAEPLVPQLGDLVLELLDQQRLVADLRAMRLPLGQQHRLQRLDVVGQRHRQRASPRHYGNLRRCRATTAVIARVAVSQPLSPPPAAARSAAAAASRCPPAGSRAAPA